MCCGLKDITKTHTAYVPLSCSLADTTKTTCTFSQVMVWPLCYKFLYGSVGLADVTRTNKAYVRLNAVVWPTTHKVHVPLGCGLANITKTNKTYVHPVIWPTSQSPRTSRLCFGQHLADKADGLALLSAAGSLPVEVVNADHRAIGQWKLVSQHKARVTLLLGRLLTFS